MRSNDKLIRRECPACRAEITLGTSSLNRKIQCPKCRQGVVIPGGSFIAAEPDSDRETAATVRDREVQPAREESLPIEVQAQTRFGGEETKASNGHSHDEEKGPVVYCLCNGVLKKRIISKDWGPAKSVCCMKPNECEIHGSQ